MLLTKYFYLLFEMRLFLVKSIGKEMQKIFAAYKKIRREKSNLLTKDIYTTGTNCPNEVNVMFPCKTSCLFHY